MISDFGGVLTTPLIQSFAAFQDQTGITPESLGDAMARMTEQTGKHPLFELECGRMTEEEFLRGLEAEITGTGGQQPHLQRFREIYFDALNPNPPMIGLMEELREEYERGSAPFVISGCIGPQDDGTARTRSSRHPRRRTTTRPRSRPSATRPRTWSRRSR